MRAMLFVCVTNKYLTKVCEFRYSHSRDSFLSPPPPKGKKRIIHYNMRYTDLPVYHPPCPQNSVGIPSYVPPSPKAIKLMYNTLLYQIYWPAGVPSTMSSKLCRNSFISPSTQGNKCIIHCNIRYTDLQVYHPPCPQSSVGIPLYLPPHRAINV